jgi:hypothetical protein
MKLLALMASEELGKKLKAIAADVGFDFIWYKHAQKAMDNLEEIAPDAACISALDFPRHWKTFVAHSRDSAGHTFPIMLLKGKGWTDDEAEKAKALEISALANADSPDALDETAIRNFLHALQPELQIPEAAPPAEAAPEAATPPSDDTAPASDATASAQSAGAAPEEEVILPFKSKRFFFAFNDPLTDALVSGEVSSITDETLNFIPDEASLAVALHDNSVLRLCTLRAGRDFLSPVCRISVSAFVNSEHTIDFVSFPEGEKERLVDYLKS